MTHYNIVIIIMLSLLLFYKKLQYNSQMESKQVQTLYILKQNGNNHIKSKKFNSASVYFLDIISLFEDLIQKQLLQTEQHVEKLIKQIKIPAHKNLSLCFLKMQQYQHCIDHCEEVLTIQANNIKILYRIGKAYLSLNNYETAQTYLKRGYAVDPFQNEIMKALEQVQIMRHTQKQKNKQKIFSHLEQQQGLTQKSVIQQAKSKILSIIFFPIYVFILIFRFFLQKCQSTIQYLQRVMPQDYKKNALKKKEQPLKKKAKSENNETDRQ